MQSSYFFYISKHVVKNLLAALLAITLAVTVIDYLQHGDKIATVGNQTILYLFYTWEFRLAQFYPLAIVFASVLSYMTLVRSNTWVSLRAFGYTRKQLFVPFILPPLVLYLSLLLLQTGPFSYGREKAWSILHPMQQTRAVSHLFFKYNHSFVYVKKLDPIYKILEDVTVFVFKEGRVDRIVTMKDARFDGQQWLASRATQMQKRYSHMGILQGFDKSIIENYALLQGYKPKVIELIYEGDSLSFSDAMRTYRVLQKQGLDTNKIKASFYNKALLPLFSLALLAILFFRTPYFERYMNRELVWMMSLGGTLVLVLVLKEM